jgi:hypothetical protein
VSYIETEFSTIPSKINTADLLGFNTQLRQLQNNRNEKSKITSWFALQHDAKKRCSGRCEDFNTNFVTKLHTDLKLTMNVSPCAIKILYCVLWSPSIYLKFSRRFYLCRQQSANGWCQYRFSRRRNVHERLLVAHGDVQLLSY